VTEHLKPIAVGPEEKAVAEAVAVVREEIIRAFGIDTRLLDRALSAFAGMLPPAFGPLVREAEEFDRAACVLADLFFLERRVAGERLRQLAALRSWTWRGAYDAVLAVDREAVRAITGDYARQARER
jgi:hypothetical protein